MFNKEFPYIKDSLTHFFIASILGVIIVFILFSMQPFDSNQFQHPHKTIYLIGYGVIIFAIYNITHFFENIYYTKTNRWTWGKEIISQFLLFLFTGIICYYYNTFYVNKFQNSYFFSLVGFLIQICLPFMPFVMIPSILLRKYFSNKTDVFIDIPSIHFVTLEGQNKGENIILEKKNILLVKVLGNYVQVYYLKDEKVYNELLRNTLQSVHKQTSFLTQCHRSYLVNLFHVKKLKGNSQKSVLILNYIEDEIPISKKYYSQLKKEL